MPLAIGYRVSPAISDPQQPSTLRYSPSAFFLSLPHFSSPALLPRAYINTHSQTPLPSFFFIFFPAQEEKTPATVTATAAATMRSEVSSLTLNLTPLPRLLPGARRSPAAANCGFKRQQQQQLPPCSRASYPSPSIRASDDRGRPPVRTLGSPEPPWLVLPPSPPENPFSGEEWPPQIQMKGAGGTSIPLSLRMVQMKKRLATAAPRWTESLPPAEGDRPGAVEGPTGRAVSALVCMIGELQRSVLAGRDGGDVDESVLDRASRDRRDSFVWLFQRVFFSSPNLVVSLLVLLANYVAFAAEENSSTTRSAAAATASDTSDAGKPAHNETVMLELEGSMAGSASESFRLGDYLNWFDIGIKEGNLDPRQHEDEETCVDRRRRVYERAIAEGVVSSLILSNYAQFLYRVANDHDRAEQYFQWAFMAEPRDAEAISRYAIFLWEERGDISGAEEMFLEAIEVEPGNHHYSSNYAWFLWKTGALDTCYPLNPPPSPLPEL